MAKSDRDRLIQTFLSRNRRTRVLDPNFPDNPQPGKRAAFRPVKGQQKPRKRSSY